MVVAMEATVVATVVASVAMEATETHFKTTVVKATVVKASVVEDHTLFLMPRLKLKLKLKRRRMIIMTQATDTAVMMDTTIKLSRNSSMNSMLHSH